MNDKIFRIGGSGIEAADERVKALMNNLVNAETPGFKASDVTVRAFPVELEAAQTRLQGQLGMEPVTESVFYNYSPGALIRTGSPTDLAIGGDGFFVIQGSWGEGYTRDGRFTLDKEGRLISVTGSFPLLGQKGPITVDPGAKIEISGTGVVRVNDQVVDQVRIARIENPDCLESVNNSVFRAKGEVSNISDIGSPRVIQGYVESSNVSMIDEMTKLVMLSRLYQINTKIITSRDAMLTRAMEMGKTQ